MFRKKVGPCSLSSITVLVQQVGKKASYTANVSWSNSLAYLEMRMILAKLFWKYDLCWMNTNEVDWERDTKGYTLWEKPELRCMFKARTT